MNYTNPFFPHTPYDSQKLFMQNIIETLQHKKVGIFESPTGTGKSLTLLSAVMEFLQKENARLEDNEKKEDDLDWLNDFGKNKKRTFTEISEEKKEVIKQLKPEIKNQLKDEFDEFLLDYNQYKIRNINLESNKDKIQVFYCTRTHSQIAQIFSEIKKIKQHSKDFHFKCVSIGSRKHLCINTSVRKLENVYMINEKCKEMHRKDKCQFNANIDVLSDIIHKKLLDIEEIHKLGTEIKICSYYGCRNSLTDADIIVLPYNQILHSSLRNSLNIDLKNKIIIFDEAHNLIDSLLSLYSVEITMEKIYCLLIQINFYYDKFKDRLKSLNSMYLRQLIRLVENFLIFFIDFTEGKLNLSSSIMTVTFLLFKCNINDIDFFKIRDFIEKAELVNKIDWFFDSIIKDTSRFEKEYEKFVKETLGKNEKILKYFDRENEKIKEKFNSLKGLVMYFEKGFISQFSEFLRCITYLDEDGKISIERNESIILI
jgi:chromosome transmission fidelity protein 1